MVKKAINSIRRDFLDHKKRNKVYRVQVMPNSAKPNREIHIVNHAQIAGSADLYSKSTTPLIANV